MFCPRCGSSQKDEVNFCKACGANLNAVRQVVDTRETSETSEKFDWSRTWVAEMFMSAEEQKRRKELLQRERGVTPELKRYTEIKAGVIVSSVGIGLGIFLNSLMQGIIAGGNVSPQDAAVLSRLWVVGVIPLFVGVALMINGLVVSKRIVESARRESETGLNSLPGGANPRALRPADTNEFIPADFSVTEGTTTHLNSSVEKQ
jgi:zinc-ribbon domain